VEKPDAKPFAAAVRLENKGAVTKMPACRRGEQLLAGNKDRFRGADARSLQGRVLPRLADFEARARLPLTTRRPYRSSQASTDAVSSAA
jgi:hypothetical protein